MTNKSFFSSLLWPLLALIVFAALLFVERTGVRGVQQKPVEGFLPQSAIQTGKRQPETECLVIYNGKADSMFYSNILYVLDSMSVGYRTYDANKDQTYDLSQYRTVILALTDLDLIRPTITGIMDWVKAGGQLLLAYPPEPSPTLYGISEKLGILNSDLDYALQQRALLTSDLLPGGQGQEFDWGAERYGLVVQLADDCTVYMVSVGTDQQEVPMLWECPLGQGKVVVNNNDAFVQRESRGLVAAAYSLLGDAFAYPVINASMFFLDDFPAPIPEGHNPYIDQFYNMDINSFYMNVWFPSMLDFARRYGLKYTGLLVETYDDVTTPPFPAVTQADSTRYFGNILLQDGHEIGLHGYNHQPLVLENFDYQGLYDYKKWGSVDDMAEATQEAIRFSRQEIPGSWLKTYVPPSNVLSDEARQMLHDRFPQINVISSVYLGDYCASTQEFDVGKDGIIDLPRIISGCELTDYDRWAVLSELNFHYVNSQFIHPDDALDPARGAQLGWEKLSADLDSYLQWLYGSAKGIRNLTAQQGGMAVQRYCNLTVQRKYENGIYSVDLGGFYDEAWLLVRCNEGTPGSVKGGSLQNVCGDLYLLHATSAHVEIALKGANSP